MNENKVSQEDVETFENIFCLLVDGSEAPTSRGQSPPPARPSDRSVTPQPSLSPFTAHITVTKCSGLCKLCFIWVCRGASLLELAVLALQAKHQKVAEECLKELKSAGEAVSVQCVPKTSSEERKSLETCKCIHECDLPSGWGTLKKITEIIWTKQKTGF